MKIICLINTVIIINFFVNIMPPIVYAYDNVYDAFVDETKKYDKIEILESFSETTDNSAANTMYVIKKAFDNILNEFKLSLKYFLEIMFVCIVSSFLKSFVGKSELCEISVYTCFCVCAYIVLSFFKILSSVCLETIRNLTDYMKIAIPTYASIVASCGYVSTASTMQNIFVVISVVITDFIVKMIYPFLYYSGLLTSVNGISTSLDFTRVIKLISKMIKYAVGIVMTIFAGIIGFAGFTSGAGDNVAVKTIKYTVSNFVPIVGTCLSDALNSITQSSIAVKNSIGYIGFVGIISLCLIPVVKVGVSIIVLRLSASVADLFLENHLGTMVDAICDIMSTMVSMLVFTIAIFILVIGIMTSIG